MKPFATFKDSMRAATRAGTKGETRRLVGTGITEGTVEIRKDCIVVENQGVFRTFKPRYPEGEYYFREPLKVQNRYLGPVATYLDDGDAVTPALPWRWKNAVLPGMFMPPEAARAKIIVLSWTVHWLLEITEGQCRAEGVEPAQGIDIDRAFLEDFPCFDEKRPYKMAYSKLWEQINGKGSWKRNPLVFAYRYEYHPL